MRPTIAAVIPTLNRKASLRQCLDALLSQTRPVDEILVVDNGSSDGTADMVRQEYAGSVRLIENLQNVGSTGGFSQGLGLCFEAGHDAFWLLDDDCLPQPEALERLCQASEKNPGALYGPRVLDPRSGEPVWYRWGNVTLGAVKVQSLALGGML